MRIIFAVQGPCVPYLFAGGPVDVHHLALTLASEGHDVAVATALPGLPESVRFRQLPYRLAGYRQERTPYLPRYR